MFPLFFNCVQKLDETKGLVLGGFALFSLLETLCCWSGTSSSSSIHEDEGNVAQTRDEEGEQLPQQKTLGEDERLYIPVNVN